MDANRKGQIARLYLANQLRDQVRNHDAGSRFIDELTTFVRLSGRAIPEMITFMDAVIMDAVNQERLTPDELDTLGVSYGTAFQRMLSNFPRKYGTKTVILTNEELNALAYKFLLVRTMHKGMKIGCSTRREIGNTAKRVGLEYVEALDFAKAVAEDVLAAVFHPTGPEPKSAIEEFPYVKGMYIGTSDEDCIRSSTSDE